MAMGGHPDYSGCSRISERELNNKTKEEILYSYIIIRTDFEFPANIKYPSIPCYVDESCRYNP